MYSLRREMEFLLLSSISSHCHGASALTFDCLISGFIFNVQLQRLFYHSSDGQFLSAN